MNNYKLIISDVDGTLSESRQEIDEEMSILIVEILKTKLFCVISGGSEILMFKQLRPLLERRDIIKENLLISATSGSTLLRYIKGNVIQNVYKITLSKKEKQQIMRIINTLITRFNLKPITKDSGPLVEDRDAQITLSCLGHQAPIDLKKTFDSDRALRSEMIKFIYNNKNLNVGRLTMRIGGTTSIDFTRKGIDKKYGIKKLLEHVNLKREDAIFFGDRTDKNGNDFIDNYVRTIQINSISQMKEYLRNIGKL